MKELSQSPRQIARRAKRAAARKNRDTGPVLLPPTKEETQARQFSILFMINGEWRVHRSSCKDVQKDLRTANHNTLIAADTADRAIDIYLEGELTEMGWTADAFHICNCACNRVDVAMTALTEYLNQTLVADGQAAMSKVDWGFCLEPHGTTHIETAGYGMVVINYYTDIDATVYAWFESETSDLVRLVHEVDTQFNIVVDKTNG